MGRPIILVVGGVGEDLPLPDGATILSSSVMQADGQNLITVALNVDGEVAELGDAVKQQIEGAGWTDAGGMESPDAFYWSFTKDDLTVAVAAAPGATDGGVDVNYVVTPSS